MTRRIVIVSGAPGSGKTTLARPLAARLGLPLFSKDLLKESLARSLGGGSDLHATRRLGGAAMELIWSLATQAPAAVLEANFRPRSAYERQQLLGLGAEMTEVHCDCGLDEASRRFSVRAASSTHDRNAHPFTALSAEVLAEYDRPVGVGRVIVVDTRQAVDIDNLARDIESRWKA